MQSKYVQIRDGNVYAGTSRVTLDTIILNWRAGSSPEVVHEDFPTVTLATVYGAIAYYLEHKEEMDQHLRDNEELWRARRSAEEAADPAFYATMRQRLAASRHRRASSQEVADRDFDAVEATNKSSASCGARARLSDSWRTKISAGRL